MTAIDKAALLAPRLAEEDVEIPGVGTVRVRALSRFEAGQVAKREDTDARERLIITLGLVEPRLEEHEVGEWMKVATPGDINAVSLRIGQLSGLLEDSPKAAFPGDGEQP